MNLTFAPLDKGEGAAWLGAPQILDTFDKNKIFSSIQCLFKIFPNNLNFVLTSIKMHMS